ncbi:MAG: DinB family protein, partial [Anaerolineales bacterium]
MEFPRLLALMERDAERIKLFVEGVSDDQARWKPNPESWSILEVTCHLGDEEREDFRTRLDIILHRPEAPWPPIDPREWVAERKYNERDLGGSLASFLSERRASLEWLRGLG